MKVERPLRAFDATFGEEKWTVYDAWGGMSMGKQNKVERTLPSHGCVLLMLNRR